MKSFTTRSVTVLAIAATLGLSAPVAAFADSTTTTLPTTSTTVATNTTTTPSPMKTWRIAEKAYLDERAAINQTYKAAVATARSAYDTALSTATTSAEKATARTTLDAALAAAVTARIAAFTALGNPPAAPSSNPLGAYIDQVQTINEAYRASVMSAQATYAAALLSSTTGAERATAAANLKLAVANAEVTRAAALTALGAPPAATTGTNTYRQQLKAINKTYEDAVAAAKSTYFSQITSATTSAERATIKAAEELAIANAAVARAAALTALGAPPAG